MTRFYALVFFLFYSLAAVGQGLPGYVVTLKGDTLRGIVRESAQQGSISLHIPHQPEQKFTAQEVRGYGLLHNSLIRSHPVKRATDQLTYAFVLPEQEGAIGLYAFADGFGLLLRPAETDTLYELQASNWHLMLHRYLGQCQALDFSTAHFLSQPYTETRVQQFVSQYNQCVEPGWRPTTNHRSVWWSGITGYASRFSAKQNSEPTGSGWQAGLDWTALRASGFQTAVGVSYSRLLLTASDYTGHHAFSAPVLAAGIHLSQRIAKPNGPGLVVGGGIRLGYSAGTVALLYQAKAGGVVPFGHQQEVELTGTFQRFLDVNCIGLQAAYTLYKK